MARTSPLTVTEQYAIKGMAQEGMTVKEISQRTGRGETTIQKYIDENVAESLPENKIGPKVREKLLRTLIKNGVEEKKARESINILNGRLNITLGDKVEEEKFLELYNACLQQQSAREMFITKTDGGNTGVAVMTPGASQRGERRTATKNNLRDCIFRPNGD